MLGRLALWFAERLAKEKFVIERLGTKEPYLTRYTLFGKRFEGTGPAVFLHHFHRSDLDDLHDHPWSFMSFILGGGYWEKSPGPGWRDGTGPLQRRWYGVGRILWRTATWCHAVELQPGSGPVVTLVLRWPKSRSWGFYCKHGYRPWRTYIEKLDAGQDGCA